VTQNYDPDCNTTVTEKLVERTTIAGETEELGENLPQRHFVPPQIPHDQIRARTRAAAVDEDVPPNVC
jgi:hypothetical protein